MSEIYGLLSIMETVSVIPENYKLKTLKDDKLFIEPISLVNSIKRFINRENRETGITVIGRTVDKLGAYFEAIVDDWNFNKKINEETCNDLDFLKQYSVLSSIFIHFKNASKGIDNLKVTYSRDENTCFKLELIQFKLSKYCRLFETKYNKITQDSFT